MSATLPSPSCHFLVQGHYEADTFRFIMWCTLEGISPISASLKWSIYVSVLKFYILKGEDSNS